MGHAAYRWAQGEVPEMVKILGRLGFITEEQLDRIVESGRIILTLEELIEAHESGRREPR